MDRAGKPFEFPMKVFCPCRGDRLVARSARLNLRKPADASKERTHPADAFCPEGSCPRAWHPTEGHPSVASLSTALSGPLFFMGPALPEVFD